MSSVQGSHRPGFIPVERTHCFSFIDYDNMKKGLQQFLDSAGVPQDRRQVFDLQKLFRLFWSDRYFFYSAVPDDGQVDDQVARIRQSPNFVFRSGVLTKNSGRTKQQGVDVLLSIDAMQHAFRQTMKNCHIFSGDGDFLPLIDALVDFGIYTRVVSFGNPEKSPVASSLRDASDEYFQIGWRILVDCFSDGHAMMMSGTQDGNSIIRFGDMHSFRAGQSNRLIFHSPSGPCLVVLDEIDPEILEAQSNVRFSQFRSLFGCEEFLRLSATN